MCICLVASSPYVKLCIHAGFGANGSVQASLLFHRKRLDTVGVVTLYLAQFFTATLDKFHTKLGLELSLKFPYAEVCRD